MVFSSNKNNDRNRAVLAYLFQGLASQFGYKYLGDGIGERQAGWIIADKYINMPRFPELHQTVSQFDFVQLQDFIDFDRTDGSLRRDCLNSLQDIKINCVH